MRKARKGRWRGRRRSAGRGFTLAEICVSGAILLVIMLVTMQQWSGTSRELGELEEDVEINYDSLKLLNKITADIRMASLISEGATVNTTDQVPREFDGFSPSRNGKLELEFHHLDFSSGEAVNKAPSSYKVRFYLEKGEERGTDVDGRTVTTYTLMRSSNGPKAPADPQELAKNILAFVACRVKTCPSRVHLRLVIRNITKNRKGRIRLAYTSKLETIVKTRGLTDTNLGSN